MYRIPAEIKRDPQRRWALPDRIFFACGACHILAYAFLNRYPDSGFRPIWIKPAKGFAGNHIIATRVADGRSFDYHGFSCLGRLIEHEKAKARRWWPCWDCSLVELPAEVLVSEPLSRSYEGLWLREPEQFLSNALPRADRFLDRFRPPPTLPGY